MFVHDSPRSGSVIADLEIVLSEDRAMADQANFEEIKTALSDFIQSGQLDSTIKLDKDFFKPTFGELL